MLSPADYAAYSQATGRPYPQSDEEKANIYGDVRNFRQNQMKSDDGPGLAGTLAIGAGILGGAIGAGALGRSMLARSKRAQTKVVPKTEGASGQRGVQRGDLSELATVRRIADLPENQIPYVEDYSGNKKIDSRGAAPQARTFKDTNADNTLVDIQERREPLVQQQSVEATDTAFDQKVQDLQSAVQRNEDVDLSSIDFDSSARRFFTAEREKIKGELMDAGGGYTPSDVEAELARRVGAESSEYGKKYTQRKQAMQLYATYGGDLKDNLKADSVVVGGINVPVSELKTEFVSPATAEGVMKQREFAKDQLGQQRLEITMERNRRNQATNALEAFDNDPEVAELRAKIEGKDEAMQIAAANADMKVGTADEAFNNSVYNAMLDDKADLEFQLERKTNDMIGYSPQELGELAGAEAYERGAQRGITRDFPKRLGDNYDEGSRLFFEQDPETGDIISETMERRSGFRRQVPNTLNEDLTQAASGTGIRGKSPRPFMAEAKADESELNKRVRQIQGPEIEEDPRGGIGVYGEQIDGTPEGAILPGTQGDLTPQGNYLPNTETAKRRPTEPKYSDEEIASAGMAIAEADPAGDVPIAPDYDAVVESLGSKEATEAGRKSILMSEAVRKGGYSNYTPDGKPRRQEPIRSSTLARTGKIEQEVADLGAEMRGLRRDVQALDARGQEERMGPRSRVSGLQPQQRSIPGVTGFAARQRSSEADKAAAQLESYMAGLQRGRASRLTSDVVIQPKLF